jgi:secreted PhoX family phosphatase
VTALPLRLLAADAGREAAPFPGFRSIDASGADELRVPEGFAVDLIAAWQDEIAPGLRFGFNCDWTGFLPLGLARRRPDPAAPHRGFAPSWAGSDAGLLVVNHEYPNPTFVGSWDGRSPKRSEQLAAELDCVGLSVLKIARGRDGRWRRVADRRTRRVTALTPCRLTGPAAGIDGGPDVTATMANCSGGLTPWGTVLSCEENHQHYPGPESSYRWPEEPYGRRHYGWVVELDPFDPNDVPRKHTALGRMRHENAAVRVAADGRIVVYMGDDRVGGCFYKFVSTGKWRADSDREEARRLLEDGVLHAADMDGGRWLPLPAETEALGDAHAAALSLGATALDRPEDVEVHPGDGSVYLALTLTRPLLGAYGSILRIEDTGGDPTASELSWEVFATGGPDSGFAAPDNLVFDGQANLWMATDGLPALGGAAGRAAAGNDALFVLATDGPEAGRCRRFATGPIEAELTGPSWTPDFSTLFLSVQHPGEDSPSREAPSSRWPRGGVDLPRPSVVAIRGFGEA